MNNSGALSYDLNRNHKITVYNEIKGASTNIRIDSILQLIDSLWMIDSSFTNLPGSHEEYLFILCKVIAKSYLTIRNNTLLISESELNDYGRGNTLEYKLFNQLKVKGHSLKFVWNIIKQLVDQNIFIASFFNHNKLHDEDYYIWNSPVFMCDTLLEKILSKGMAENHMHLGATRNFSDLWLETMNNQTEIKDNQLDTLLIPTFEGIISYKNYIKGCRFLRILLSIFLFKNEPYVLSFKTFICDKILKNLEYKEKKSMKELLNTIYNGEFIEQGNINFLLSILLTTCHIRKNKMNKNETYFSKIQKIDILSYFVSDYLVGKISSKRFSIVYPEDIFLIRAFRYIDYVTEHNINDDKFQRFFWQYIRLKNIFFRYIVQQHNSGKGLDIFEEIYTRQSTLETKKSKIFGLISQLKKQNIKKIEVRISPKKTLIETRRALVHILEQYVELLGTIESETKFPLLGTVYHFIKRDDSSTKKCLYKYYSTGEKNFKRDGSLQYKYRKEADIILKLIDKIPELSYYIVGVDAACIETKTEPYIFSEIFSQFRTDKRVLKIPKRIGFTYHVGEDFRDIITGLRHVDEVIEKLHFEPGDRIGHGIVIGIDIERWAELNSIIWLPKKEHLENLIWEWGVYNNDENYKSMGNIKYLENEILQIASSIFGNYEGITVRSLYDIYNAKFHTDSITIYEQDECCIKPIIEREFYNYIRDFNKSNWDREKLFIAFNCEHYIKRLKETQCIPITKKLIKKYKQLQEYIKDKIINKGIIIDTNPTSNLLIGDFESYKEYYITNLSSPKNNNIIVTVNSDDPLIFNTNLTNEFAMLYDFLIEKNEYGGKNEILDWIDTIRENALQYSFIEDRKLSKEKITCEVKSIIKKLNRLI
jgi:adenosine deaminase